MSSAKVTQNVSGIITFFSQAKKSCPCKAYTSLYLQKTIQRDSMKIGFLRVYPKFPMALPQSPTCDNCPLGVKIPHVAYGKRNVLQLCCFGVKEKWFWQMTWVICWLKVRGWVRVCLPLMESVSTGVLFYFLKFWRSPQWIPHKSLITKLFTSTRIHGFS